MSIGAVGLPFTNTKHLLTLNTIKGVNYKQTLSKIDKRGVTQLHLS